MELDKRMACKQKWFRQKWHLRVECFSVICSGRTCSSHECMLADERIVRYWTDWKKNMNKRQPRHGVSGVPRVSRARRQTQFWPPHPLCSWQHRCEEWVWNKRGVERWLGPCNRLRIVVSRPVWKLPVIVTSHIWGWDLWIMETINYRRGKNPVVPNLSWCIPPFVHCGNLYSTLVRARRLALTTVGTIVFVDNNDLINKSEAKTIYVK